MLQLIHTQIMDRVGNVEDVYINPEQITSYVSGKWARVGLAGQPCMIQIHSGCEEQFHADLMSVSFVVQAGEE